MLNCSSIIIIPCKMDSKRLKKKNLSVIDNKTLLEYAILYAQNSKYVNKIKKRNENIS